MSDRLAQLRALLAEEPDDVFLRYAIALEHARAGDHDTAITDLEALVISDPDHVATYYQLAELLVRVGRDDDAIAACKAGMLQCLVSGERKMHAELNALADTIEEGA